MWKLTYKWVKHSHPNKPKNWIVKRYFGKFNPSRQDKWVFGHRDSGAYLRKFCWTKIIRHQLVSGTSSPDDPRRSTKPRCACSGLNTAAVHSVGTSFCTPTKNRKAPRNGSSGSGSPAGR